MRGVFIVIEGIDGAGKGIACKELVKLIKEHGYDVWLTNEPFINSTIGNFVKNQIVSRCLLPETEALLFAADRHEHYWKHIKPKLDKGTSVICCRYVYSTFAYQGGVGSLPITWLVEINKNVGVPDIVLYIDTMPEVALVRIKSCTNRSRQYFEKERLLKIVREKYLDMFERKKIVNKFLSTNIITVKNTGTIQEYIKSLHKMFHNKILPLLNERIKKV